MTSQSICRNLLRGDDFLEILRDSSGKILFFWKAILSVSGDVFVSVTSIIAENDIKRFPEGGTHSHGSSSVDHCQHLYYKAYSV